MHPSLLDEVYAVRLSDRYREAEHARRVARARRVGALPRRRPVRALLGRVKVAAGGSLAGHRAPRPVTSARTR